MSTNSNSNSNSNMNNDNDNDAVVSRILPRVFANGTPVAKMVKEVQPEATASTYLSVLSCNLLAPLYVRPLDRRTGAVQPYAAFEWITADDTPKVLDVASRGPRLAALIGETAADVVCLQELQLERRDDGSRNANAWNVPDWLQPLILLDDKAEKVVSTTIDHQGNTTIKYKLRLPPLDQLEDIAERNRRVLDADVAITNAVLFRPDRVRVVTNSGQGKKKRNNKNSKNETDTNTCVSVCLELVAPCNESNNDTNPIVVTSVHLDATSEVKRVAQLTKCLQRTKELLWDVHDDETLLRPITTIIAGDMYTECQTGSCVRAFLNGGSNDEVDEPSLRQQCAYALRLEEDQAPTAEQLQEWKALYAQVQRTVTDLCLVQNDGALQRLPTGPTRAAYEHNNNNSATDDKHDDKNDKKPVMGKWCLDHIFYSPSTVLQPIAYWSTLEADEESCCIGLPNHKHPSDHVPIAAVFCLSTLHKPATADHQSFLDKLSRLVRRQADESTSLQTELAAELSRIQATLPHDEDEDGKNGKKKKKSGPPPPQVQEFTRQKRVRMRQLKTQHETERNALVDTFTTAWEGLLLQGETTMTISEWVVADRS